MSAAKSLSGPCGKEPLPRRAAKDYVRGAWGGEQDAVARYSEGIMNANDHSPRRVAVYCGSSNGSHPAFRAEAAALGESIAKAGIGLVYGGAIAGLMGALADAALAAGGEVIGVLPHVLNGKEIAHTGLTVLEMVPTMHERKARMNVLADGFIALPGGYGTLDELLEAVTWAQLRLHEKPCVLVNTLGYWNGLLTFLDSAVNAGFLKVENRELLRVASHAAEAVKMIASEWN